jgi:hypothetical protein
MKRLVAIFSVITLGLGAVFGGVAFGVAPQQQVSTDLIADVSEVIQLSIGNCGTTAARTVALGVSIGNFSSCKLTVNVGTNAAGYKLLINSVDTPTYQLSDSGYVENHNNKYFDGAANNQTNLVLVTSETPTFVKDTTKVIPPFNKPITEPAVMQNTDAPAWGFAVPKGQSTIVNPIIEFDNDYSVKNDENTTATGKYAGVPAVATQIRARTGAVNSQNTDVYFGTRVSSTTAPGDYKGMVLFSVVGEAPAATGGSGDNNTGETSQIGGQDIERTPAEVGTGTFQPYQLTYEDTTDDGTPESATPGGVTKVKSSVLPTDEGVNITLSVVAGLLLLGALIWLFAVLFGRRYDVLLLNVGAHKHKVAETIKHYTKIAAADHILYDVFEEMAGKPLLLIEKISKRRANKLAKALTSDGAEAKTRVHRQHKKRK